MNGLWEKIKLVKILGMTILFLIILCPYSLFAHVYADGDSCCMEHECHSDCDVSCHNHNVDVYNSYNNRILIKLYLVKQESFKQSFSLFINTQYPYKLLDINCHTFAVRHLDVIILSV